MPRRRGVVRSTFSRKARNSLCRCRGRQAPMTVPLQHMERSKQRRCAVASGVVSAPGRNPRWQRHHRLGSIQCLDMLARGGKPYDVAKRLGDTIETSEKHYTPFVRELRERVPRVMQNGEGLESWAQEPASGHQKTSN